MGGGIQARRVPWRAKGLWRTCTGGMPVLQPGQLHRSTGILPVHGDFRPSSNEKLSAGSTDTYHQLHRAHALTLELP